MGRKAFVVNEIIRYLCEMIGIDNDYFSEDRVLQISTESGFTWAIVFTLLIVFAVFIISMLFSGKQSLISAGIVLVIITVLIILLWYSLVSAFRFGYYDSHLSNDISSQIQLRTKCF